jgi:hypothetical protein
MYVFRLPRMPWLPGFAEISERLRIADVQHVPHIAAEN